MLYGDEGPVGIVHRDIEIMAHVETLSIPPYTLHSTLSSKKLLHGYLILQYVTMLIL